MPGNDAFTKLLLHFDGADASTTFLDSAVGSAPKTMTARDGAQIDTAQFKFGTGAGLFDGTLDAVDTPDHADFDFGAGDFTIDFWLRLSLLPSNTGTPAAVLSHLTDFNNLYRVFINTDNSVNFQVVDAGVQTVAASSIGTLGANTWYHIAIVRSGSAFTLYIDGAAQNGGTYAGALTDYSGIFSIGTLDGATGTWPLGGWIEEFRVSKGIARWTANFTPPTAAYDLDDVLGRRPPKAFSPRSGPTRGLTPTRAFAPDIINDPVGRTPPEIFSPRSGPTRSLTPTWAFPPDIINDPVGRTPPRIFRPRAGPGKGLARTYAFPVPVTLTLNQAIDATGAGSVVIIKSVGKSIAATGAGAVAVVKAVGKIVAAAGTGAVTVARSIGRAIAATGAGAVAIVRSVGKRVAPNGTGTVAIARVVAKGIATAGAGAVAVARVVAKRLAVLGASATLVVKRAGKTVAASGVGSVIVATPRTVTQAIAVLVSSFVEFLATRFLPEPDDTLRRPRRQRPLGIIRRWAPIPALRSRSRRRPR